MPDLFIVFIAAMAPIGELRAAIPLGLTTYDLSWPSVYAVAVAGNLIPVPLLLLALRRVGAKTERMDNRIGALLRWRTQRLEEHWSGLAQRYDFLAVVLLVAIPLPFTGAWTGSLAVWSLRVPSIRGVAAIVVGVAIAGAIVTALTEAGMSLLRVTG